MATTSNSAQSKTPPTTGPGPRATAKPAARRRAPQPRTASTSARAGGPTASVRTGARATAGRRTTTPTAARTRSEQAQVLAERAVLVPVGASLLARENLVSTVKSIATKYGTRKSVERELKRYERRGATARNRFERQVRRTRTTFERELRQRRTRVERDVRSVARDLGKQGDTITSRVEKIVSDAQERIGALS